jgi:aspartyl-tRNA(Asn)/glutamyl-tRNA(Gln) amidotransferase subunit A
VKDLFDTAGIRTTYGSAVFADHVPAQSAAWVRQLEESGWVNIGKTNLHEFAYGVTSQNLHYGVVPNPSFPGHTAGGSIRIPAACCGIAGFKPTYGLVPIDGVFPLAPTFDHAGPLARDVAGCIELLDLEVEPVSLGDLSLAVSWADRAEPLVRERVLAIPAQAVDFPTAENVSPAFMREVGDVHRELYPENAELYGENIRSKIERCIALDDAEYETALRARTEHAERALSALDGFDLLLTPTLGFVAPAAAVVETEIRGAMTLFTFPFNALGWPALAVPAGPAENGLPASIQVVGRPGDDALVLAAGLQIEAALKT